MAITLVPAHTGKHETGGLSDTWSNLGPGEGVTEGRLMVMACVAEGSRTLGAIPAGWTQLGSTVISSVNPTTLAVIAKRAGPSEAGLVTVVWTSSIRAAYGWCVLDGVDDTTMLDVAVATGTTGYGTAKDLDITTSTDGAGLVTVNATDPNTTIDMTWDDGITDVVQANVSGVNHLDVGFRLQPTAGATSMGGDWNVSRGGASILIALRPAAGGPPPATRIARRRSLLGVGR